MSYVCKYCGLTTTPLAYHEGVADCQAAMREFTALLRDSLPLLNWQQSEEAMLVYNKIVSRLGCDETVVNYGVQYER